jgi:UDP-glucuronate 4-epimerase
MLEEQRPSRVVVTGAAGFIGSHLAEALLAEGHEVVGVDAFTPSYPQADKQANLAGLVAHERFRLVRGDLTELDLDPWLQDAAAVFHQAAQPGVRSSWGASFQLYVRHNLLATQRLLEACVRVGVPRVVAASSSSVYGDAPVQPTTEASVTRPVSPYGVTKLGSEHLCLAYTGISSMQVVVLRYFTVFGPRQRPDMGVYRFLAAAQAGRPITVYGDGRQTRDFTYVSDVVRANLLALAAPIANGTILNIGSGRPAALGDVLDLIGGITGRRLRIRHEPAKPGDARHTGADIANARALLGYRPEVDLPTGLAAQAAWMANRHQP